MATERERESNEPLCRALADARLREGQVAEALGVDAKTVRRWMNGRAPHRRHRWALADLVGRHESELWPGLAGPPPILPEVYATYPDRGAVPREVWKQLFGGAEHEIGILVYSGLFVVEDIDLVRLISQKARDGVRVRIILGDPGSKHVAQRGAEEGIDGAMAAKIRNALVLYRRLIVSAPRAEIRLHPTVLYNSIFRADDQLLVNQHVYGIAAGFAPVLHLRHREDGDLTSTYADSFERVWDGATPDKPDTPSN